MLFQMVIVWAALYEWPNPKQGLNLFPQSKFNNLLCTQIGSILICESFGLSFHGINGTLLNSTRIYVHQG